MAHVTNGDGCVVVSISVTISGFDTASGFSTGITGLKSSGMISGTVSSGGISGLKTGTSGLTSGLISGLTSGLISGFICGLNNGSISFVAVFPDKSTGNLVLDKISFVVGFDIVDGKLCGLVFVVSVQNIVVSFSVVVSVGVGVVLSVVNTFWVVVNFSVGLTVVSFDVEILFVTFVGTVILIGF